MNFSDETLMAYSDGELDPQARSAIEAAIASDPDVARRVARHLALAARVRSGFDPVLREAVPRRLKDAGAGIAGAPDSDRAEAAARDDIAIARAAKRDGSKRTWSWPQWSAVAASLVIGVMAGRLGESDRPPSPMAMDGSGVVARGALERALSTQLASGQAGDAPVRIGSTFRSRSGEYCRTFVLSNEVAGLGCRAGADWRLPVIARSPAAPESSGTYRQAAGNVPPAVMHAVEERIAGHALDAREEAAALQGGWKK
jgi:hypothetical protein